MAEEENGGQEPAEQETQQQERTDEKPPWGSDDEFNPEQAWKLIQNLRGDKDKIASERDELGKKVKTHEDAAKSEQQKLEERSSTAEARASTAEQEAARLRVALRKGLTETQAKRLVGDDEEALEKDADELLADFRAKDDEPDETRRRPQERLRPGAVRTADPDSNDPKKLAAQIPRM